MDVNRDLLVELRNDMHAIRQEIENLRQQRIPKEWYTTQEAAGHLGKAEFTVREWCRLRRIHAEKRNSGRGPHAAWVISYQELQRFQREGLLPTS